VCRSAPSDVEALAILFAHPPLLWPQPHAHPQFCGGAGALYCALISAEQFGLNRLATVGPAQPPLLWPQPHGHPQFGIDSLATVGPAQPPLLWPQPHGHPQVVIQYKVPYSASNSFLAFEAIKALPSSLNVGTESRV